MELTLLFVEFLINSLANFGDSKFFEIVFNDAS